ncbi:helix-turn-helix domain-containing protein [Azospirillum thermophilum]|uniref:DNA-binding protein n=1 Tax=Azospirillum thermophilum TaxID=2202148 RepID=A0A2S2CLC2_9PROT|nr:XRE family transcriptional regulator [Azospirillum thermophilum]AWK85318.1 DNA-binding protein [Azospirillum thermophilum]
MEQTESDIDARLAARLRALRAEQGLTLDGLAERAGVSRSMISLVERGRSSPTAAVLDRLAAGLGVSVASLFDGIGAEQASPLSRRADQREWQDPATGYVRRNLTPPGIAAPVTLVEVTMPAGARVTYDTGPRAAVIHQQLYVLEGEIAFTVDGGTVHLRAGDCLASQIDGPSGFHNPADRPARYLVAVATGPARSGAGTAKPGIAKG